MIKVTTMFGFALAMLTLVGCQSNQYVPPQLSAESAATIIGSDKTASGGVKTAPSIIDGKWLSAYGQRDALTIISPGVHSIAILIETNKKTMVAGKTITLTAEPSTAYVIRASDPITMTKQCAASWVWIEKEDGELVTERVPISLNVPVYGTSLMIGSTFVSIPPRTPAPCHQ